MVFAVSCNELMKKTVFFFFAIFLTACVSSQTSLKAPPPNPTAIHAWNLEEEPLDYLTLNKRLPSGLSRYETSGLCHGLPRISVKTAPGFCVGLVDGGDGLEMPRTGLALNETQIVLTDMGSWETSVGKLFLLTWDGKTYQRKLLLDAKTMKDRNKAKIMDRPHLVLRGPDGKIYVGAAGAIGRLNPLATNVESTVEIVVDNLNSIGLHPLKSFTFDAKGKRLFVNSGASTNVCQKEGLQGTRSAFCKAAEAKQGGEAQIWVFQQGADGRYNPQYQVYARGLRNSMALYWDEEQQLLLEADNGRDAISKFNASLNNDQLPHEEFNVVTAGSHYGWPYCYDNNLVSPEWNYVDCSKFVAPYLLLPPHAAPLNLIKYQGSMFPAKYRGRYLMGLHGYASLGHRLVTFLRDNRGLPVGVPLSIIYDWNTRGEQLKGSPVGLSEMPDGSLLIVEDTSRKVVRLFYDASEGNGEPVREIDQTPAPKNHDEAVAIRKVQLEEKLRETNPPIFSRLQSQMIDKYCTACHGGTDSPGLSLLAYDDVGNAKRIRDNKKAQEILARVSLNPNWPQMPPQGMDGTDQKEAARLIQDWIKAGQP
jgi:glucose/arabinose dehydrogenase